MTITVLIADDQPLMRSALRICLDAEPDLRVVGEAADGAATVRLAERLRPDVVVMDVRMPIMDGIEATRRVVALPGAPTPRVLVMTTFDLDEHIIDALRAGASGFLVKDSPPETLIHAVRVIAAGDALLAPSVTRRLPDLEIAQELELAPSSVKTHVGHLLAKLGLDDRVQLVVFAYEHELVRPGRRDDPPSTAATAGSNLGLDR